MASKETPPPPEEVHQSPPPPAKSSPSPPAAASKAAPPPPESKAPPPTEAPAPPSPPKAPPPVASPPPPSPPPPAPSKEEPPKDSSPPPPANDGNAPPLDSNPPPADSQPNPPKEDTTSTLPPPDPHSPPSPPRPPTDKSSPNVMSFPPSRNDPHSPPLPIESSTHSFKPPPPSDGSSNNNVALIFGISIGGVLILALIIGCFLLARRKKKQPYYYDNERTPRDQFYNGTTEWYNQHSMEHVVNLAPPAGVMGTPVGNGGGKRQWGGVTPIQPVKYSPEYLNNSGQLNHQSPRTPMTPMGGLGHSQSQFTYEALAAATAGFSAANLLGQGGFGYVHKGVLPDGKVVAVKSLKSGSGQGEREFQAEVEIISRVHHRHLVSLVGYCIADGQRMLVYEFVPNSTMEHHLHGKGQPVMDWTSRVRIAIGSAKGLAYLHEDCHPRIIHRDIKAANILLDENYEAMVADFGLAKLTTDNVTHVSTRVMGTFGYLAPEYASSGKLTEKSDVFSFGVMLLELITGRRPVGGQVMDDSLVDWARPIMQQALEDGNYDELADPKLEGKYDLSEMISMISCAAASIRHSAKRRPKMSQIVRALEGESTLLEENDASKTVKTKSNNASGSTSTHDPSYDTVAYNADMMKFRKMVMSSQEFGASSEFGTTSEYGLNQSASSSSDNSSELGARTGSMRQKF